MLDLTHKVALVTGGGTGIGLATTQLLASQGCTLVVNYRRSQAAAEQAVEQIRAAGGQATAMQADVGDPQQIEAMFAEIDQQFGGLDLLVNNAATTQMIPSSELDAMTDQIWDEIMAVNVKGTFHCCRHAIPRMKSRGGGGIVNVSSIAGMTGLGSCIAYSASKAAVNNMTRALAASSAPDVRVNAVAPGVVETRWIEGWEKFTDPHREATPMKRHAQPLDIALAIHSLLVHPFVTGEVLRVDGGRTLGSS